VSVLKSAWKPFEYAVSRGRLNVAGVDGVRCRAGSNDGMRVNEDEKGCCKSYKKLPSCGSMVSPIEGVTDFDDEVRGTKRKMRVVQGTN
jgi:hypothetical protein